MVKQVYLYYNSNIGNLITSSVKDFDFSTENIHRINKIIDKNISKISPAYFSKICGTTGLIIFMIKDALEYSGVIQEKKVIPARVYKNYLYNTEIITEKLNRLKNLLNNIYKV